MGFSVPPYPSSLSVTGLALAPHGRRARIPGRAIPLVLRDDPRPATGRPPAPGRRLCSAILTTPRTSTPTTRQLPARNPNQTEYSDRLRRRPRQHHRLRDGVPGLVAAAQLLLHTTAPESGARLCGACRGRRGAGRSRAARPQPADYHTVHFRYLWAGQKTFTMFSQPEHHAQVDRGLGVCRPPERRRD